MCSVDLEKAYDCRLLEVMWGVLREYGPLGTLLQAVWFQKRAVSVYSTKSQICFWWLLGFTNVAHTSDPVWDIHAQDLKESRGEECVRYRASELYLCSLLMTCLSWLRWSACTGTYIPKFTYAILCNPFVVGNDPLSRISSEESENPPQTSPGQQWCWKRNQVWRGGEERAEPKDKALKALTFSCELWVVTKRMRSRMAGLSLRDRLRSWTYGGRSD